MSHTFNPVSWSVSRGADTFGYNICRIDSGKTGRRYRTKGGGYDMLGTVLGELLENEYSDILLKALSPDVLAAHGCRLVDCGYAVPGWLKVAGDGARHYYGAFIRPDGTLSLDGACGRESIIAFAEVAGLSVTASHNRRGHVIGYFISTKGE